MSVRKVKQNSGKSKTSLIHTANSSTPDVDALASTADCTTLHTMMIMMVLPSDDGSVRTPISLVERRDRRNEYGIFGDVEFSESGRTQVLTVFVRVSF